MTEHPHIIGLKQPEPKGDPRIVEHLAMLLMEAKRGNLDSLIAITSTTGLAILGTMPSPHMLAAVAVAQAVIANALVASLTSQRPQPPAAANGDAPETR